jgi:hypothetical protein
MTRTAHKTAIFFHRQKGMAHRQKGTLTAKRAWLTAKRAWQNLFPTSASRADLIRLKDSWKTPPLPDTLRACQPKVIERTSGSPFGVTTIPPGGVLRTWRLRLSVVKGVIGTILKRLLEYEDDGEDFDVKAAAEGEPGETSGTLEWKGLVYDFYIRQHYAGPLTGEQAQVMIGAGGKFLGAFPLEKVLRGEYLGNQFVPFELTWPFRVWLKKQHYPLEIKIDDRGFDRTQIVREALDDDVDIKDLSGEHQPERIYSMEEIKAAEPGFFNRENTRFFGTKKVYKYGNSLVLKNVRRVHGHFGQMNTWTSYVIYEFTKTDNSPQGVVLHRQSTNELYKAKAMIKRRDFRPWNEQVADDYRLGMLGI